MPEQVQPAVLVADDDENIQIILRVLLERHGFRVDGVRDGLEAIAHLRSNSYSTILLDLLMPRINGFEVIWHLKALQPELLNRVVVMTAASEPTLGALDTTLVYGVIRKPFELDVIVSVVSDCSHRTVGGRSPPPLYASHA